MDLDKALAGLLFKEEVIDAIEAYRQSPNLINRAIIIQAVVGAYRQMEEQNDKVDDPQSIL